MICAGGLVCVALLGSALLLPPGVVSSKWPESRCDPVVIEQLEKFWCKFGRPGNIMAKAYDKVYYAASRSPSNLTQDIACLYYTMPTPTTKGDSSLATWHYAFANGTVFNQTTNMTEQCGKIYVKETKSVIYVIRDLKGIYLTYRCSMDESAPCGPPSYEIYTKEKYNTAAYKECKDNLAEYFYATKLDDFMEGCKPYFENKGDEDDDESDDEDEESDESEDDDDEESDESKDDDEESDESEDDDDEESDESKDDDEESDESDDDDEDKD